jgi:glycosyltransferase involved in cell wall biosynthesis
MNSSRGAAREDLRVSIVIPARDSEATLGDTLRALRSQVGVTPLELLVVDNGSTDGTAEVAWAAGATVLTEPTPGPSAARNCGLTSARGDVVAHVDADTVPTSRWLSAITRPFVDDAVVLVAGRNVSYPPETAAERYIAASGLIETERAVRRAQFPFAPSMNMAVRREAAIAVGGWAEELATGEDVDFSHRVCRHFDCPITYAAGAVVLHRNRASDAALRHQAWTYGEGAAALYRRYPDEIRWTPRIVTTLAGQLVARAVRPLVLGAARHVNHASDDEVEFARYHRMWTWMYWRGFAARYWARPVAP